MLVRIQLPMRCDIGTPLKFVPLLTYSWGSVTRKRIDMPTHSETRALPYTAQQMYDLVAGGILSEVFAMVFGRAHSVGDATRRVFCDGG